MCVRERGTEANEERVKQSEGKARNKSKGKEKREGTSANQRRRRRRGGEGFGVKVQSVKRCDDQMTRHFININVLSWSLDRTEH